MYSFLLSFFLMASSIEASTAVLSSVQQIEVIEDNSDSVPEKSLEEESASDSNDESGEKETTEASKDDPPEESQTESESLSETESENETESEAESETESEFETEILDDTEMIGDYSDGGVGYAAFEDSGQGIFLSEEFMDNLLNRVGLISSLLLFQVVLTGFLIGCQLASIIIRFFKR